MELELFDDLIKLARTESFGEICFAIGKFIESVTIRDCMLETGKKPRNTNDAIDTLTKAAIISPTLGAKLHVVRNLRNAHTHELTNKFININNVYQPKKADARFAVEVLNEFLEGWMKRRSRWNGTACWNYFNLANEFLQPRGPLGHAT